MYEIDEDARSFSRPPRASLRLVGREDAAPAIDPFLAATENAVLRTVIYADVFDSALSHKEVVRYCVAPGGRAGTIEDAIDRLLMRGALLECDGYIHLPGRKGAVTSRRRLSALSRREWGAARRWGRVLWMLPFVRMVAVTGSLAADSKTAEGDIDYMIVVEPGRIWLTRACCLVVWRLARVSGTHLCPNYLVSSGALAIERHDLYTARELVQMVPLHGRFMAMSLWLANRWSLHFLPNAALDVTRASDTQPLPLRALKRGAERLLGGSLGDRLERWECGRKIAQLTAEVSGTHESTFSADVCKHHAHAHGGRVLERYARRVSQVLSSSHQFEDEESAPPGERLIATD